MTSFGPHEYRHPRHAMPIPVEGPGGESEHLDPAYEEVEQIEDYGPVPPLPVTLAAPAHVLQLPSHLAVCRTLGVLAPERILPADPRRSKATLIASVNGLRIAKSIAELRAGGAGQVGVASSGTGPQFSTSGGGTGGFLLPSGLVLVVSTQDALYASSDDYGVNNGPCMLSLIIEQWAQ